MFTGILGPGRRSGGTGRSLNMSLFPSFNQDSCTTWQGRCSNHRGQRLATNFCNNRTLYPVALLASGLLCAEISYSHHVYGDNILAVFSHANPLLLLLFLFFNFKTYSSFIYYNPSAVSSPFSSPSPSPQLFLTSGPISFQKRAGLS